MEGWKEYRLGDVCSQLSDGLHKAPKFKLGGDYIFVNAKNISNGFIVDNDLTKKSTHEEYLKYSSPLDDTSILYSIDGTIGNVALYRGEKVILGKGACYLNPMPNILDRFFLYYELLSPRFKAYIDKMSTGSTIKHISLKTMRNYSFVAPPLQQQRQIACILSSIDNKITCNRQINDNFAFSLLILTCFILWLLKLINDNLQQQARALYKSWFVDFEPFLDGEFVESEMGMIPKGWKVGNLFDISEVLDKYRKPLSGQERYLMDKIYPYYGATSCMDYVDDYLFDGIYTLIGEDGSVVKEDGLPYMQYVWGKLWVNNHAHILQGKNGFSTEMLHVMLSTTNIRHLVTGAVQAKLSQANMQKILVAIPSTNILDEIRPKFDKLYQLIRKNENESHRLSQLRDTLLPRMMSGELKINDLTM